MATLCHSVVIILVIVSSVIVAGRVAGRNLTGGGGRSGTDTIESDWGGVGLNHKGVAL